MKTVTTWRALMQYAGELGKARQSGDPERLAKAKAAHDNYLQLCMEADEMHLDCTVGELADIARGRVRPRNLLPSE